MGALYHAIFRNLSPLFRKKRIARFIECFKPDSTTTILDVGGYPGNWLGLGLRSRITLLNIHPLEYDPAPDHPVISTVVGDGCALPFPKRAFDIVFSNSVIEHLGTYEAQRSFAHESRRVGRGLWVQTPARSFVMEPHLITPFIHYFPRSVQKRLLRNATVWGWLTRPSPAQVEGILNEIRLLNEAEMRELYPDCEVLRETCVGMTKSYMAVRRE